MYNQRVLDEYRKVAGQEPAVSPTLDSELIKVTRVDPHRYQFHVPTCMETLAFFNQALTNNFPMVAKLEVEKSRANDWNDQLKERLRAPAQQQGRSLQQH